MAAHRVSLIKICSQDRGMYWEQIAVFIGSITL